MHVHARLSLPTSRRALPSSTTLTFCLPHLFLCSDYLFKLVLIGDTGVGKSCLLLRFADDG